MSGRVRLSPDQRTALVALCLAGRLGREEMVRWAGGWRAVDGLEDRDLIACERRPGADGVEMDLVFEPTPAGRDVADRLKRAAPRPRRTPRRVRRPGQKAGIDWSADPRLGVWFDVDLAHALGVTRLSVNSARRKLGISAAPRDAPRHRLTVLERRRRAEASARGELEATDGD